MLYIVDTTDAAGSVQLRRVHRTAEYAVEDCGRRAAAGRLTAAAESLIRGLRHGEAVRWANQFGKPLAVTAADPAALPADNSPRAVLAYAKATLEAFGLVGWSFAWDNARRRCGSCNGGRRRITLSRHFVAMNTPDAVRQTMLHEVAHALVGTQHGHGRVWQSMALTLGISSQRCNSTATMPEGKWTATCGCTGVVSSRHRKPKKLTGWSCRRCGQGVTWTGPGLVTATS